MSKNKIDIETATAEFDRFADEFDISTDLSDLNDDDRAGFNELRRRILIAIQRGALVVNEEGGVVITLRRAVLDLSSITMAVPSGAAWASMDRHKASQSTKRMYSFMGDMARISPATFSSMDGRDLKICMAVATLFLGS